MSTKYKLREDGFREGYGCRNKTNSTAKYWATRTVSKNLTVKIGGVTFGCPVDVENKPLVGERILFGRYTDYGREGYKPYVCEWAGPSDADGYIRRTFWKKVEG